MSARGVRVNDHDGGAMAAVAGSWAVALSSFFAQVMPILQGLSLIAAIVASIAAKRYYDTRRKGG